MNGSRGFALRGCSIILGFILGLAAGCDEGKRGGDETPIVRLERHASGAIALVLDHAPPTARALEVELAVSSARAFELGPVIQAPGLPLDTLRLAMRGSNRAILFAGDKRGIMLPRSGEVASFTVRSAALRASSATPGEDARLVIDRVVLADDSGTRIDVLVGPAIGVR